MERATGIEPVLPAWELENLLLYFHNLQNRSATINAHAMHTVHAVPDLRVTAGRFAGRFSNHALLLGTEELRRVLFRTEASQQIKVRHEISSVPLTN